VVDACVVLTSEGSLDSSSLLFKLIYVYAAVIGGTVSLTLSAKSVVSPS
jgi:hypothetical protein